MDFVLSLTPDTSPSPLTVVKSWSQEKKFQNFFRVTTSPNIKVWLNVVEM